MEKARECFEQGLVQDIAQRMGIRLAPSDLRQLSSGFFGVGCPHLGVECLIQQVAKLHTHYGCRSNMGLKLKVSLETMAVEMGVLSQPL